jgi:hypothetical protein
VGVLDAELGGQLEGLFLADLASSVEIVLPRRALTAGHAGSDVGILTESLDPAEPLSARIERRIRERGTSHGRLTMASVVRAGEVLGEALSGNRTLGREDRTVLGMLSIAALVVAVGAALAPSLVGWLVAGIAFWFGITMGIRAYVQARRARAEELESERRHIGTGEEET